MPSLSVTLAVAVVDDLPSANIVAGARVTWVPAAVDRRTGRRRGRRSAPAWIATVCSASSRSQGNSHAFHVVGAAAIGRSQQSLRLGGSADGFLRSGAGEVRGSRRRAFPVPGPARRTAAASSALRIRMRAGRRRSRLRLRRRRSRCLRRVVRGTPARRTSTVPSFAAAGQVGASSLPKPAWTPLHSIWFAGGLFVESKAACEVDFHVFEIRRRWDGHALGLGHT